MNPEQLIFAASVATARCAACCENLWRALPLNAAPVLDPEKCAQLAEAARALACAANALQLAGQGVKPPKTGD